MSKQTEKNENELPRIYIMLGHGSLIKDGKVYGKDDKIELLPSEAENPSVAKQVILKSEYKPATDDSKVILNLKNENIALQKKVNELESLLSKKDTIISGLLSENEGLNKKVTSPNKVEGKPAEIKTPPKTM